MTGSTTSPAGPVTPPTVLDALRASPAGPVLDLPLPALPAPVLPEPGLPAVDAESIVELLESVPVPALPELDAMVRPLIELGAMFGTGILESLDPASVLHQASRLLDTATALGRSALHALAESWEGATAEEAADHAVRAKQAAVELADRGDRIGEVTRAATASVRRGNVELTGIAQSFVATAVATAPALATPPGQAALLASAAQHLRAALVVVARTRGELAVHTAAMSTLTAPVPVPAPVGTAAGTPQVHTIATAATDVAASTAAPFTPAGTHAATLPSSYAPTVPTAHTNAITASAGVGAGVAGTLPTGVSGHGAAGAGSGTTSLPAAAPLPTGPASRGDMLPTGGAASTGRAPAGAGMIPATPARAPEDEERRSPARVLGVAAAGTAVVGDLPLVVPAVIGAGCEDR
ncbi:hypothetical protein [Rhodococcus sp. CH91]|uniref:hypothetical protein n=1 Tax=Rhodococcus sp. CH91 TaxID=2910256 RepID=UPI001F4A61AB|nr:hypothetical protein [Rhodococcus sp. CH91]